MKIILLIIASVILRFVDGWAIHLLWKWFAVPIFHLPELGIAESIGVAVLFRTLLATYERVDTEKESTTQRNLNLFVVGLVGPAVSLMVGWVVRLFL